MSLSVVIPAYNSEKFIAETLRSVLKQTLPPDEVLVIDDGSTDDTAAIAEAFGAPVRVIHQKNARQAAARNLGVREATGTWIAFNDADDLWEPDKLEKQLAELARHPDADLCYTGRVTLIQDGPVARRGKVVEVAPARKIRKALFRNTTFLPSSVVIRRSTFLALGGFDTRYTIVEDWDLWLRMLHAGIKFVSCQEPLVHYRIHSGNISRRTMTLFREKEEIFKRLVLPHVPASTRWLWKNHQTSEHEAMAAFGLRDEGNKKYLAMMSQSILRDPFHWPYRYKVLAHMLYTHLHKVGLPVPKIGMGHRKPDQASSSTSRETADS